MESDPLHAFEEHLRYHSVLPFEVIPREGPNTPLDRELRLKRALGVLAAQTAFDDKRGEAGDDLPLAPELMRLDAKLNHLIDLVGTLLTRAVGTPPAVPVEFNAWGITWRGDTAPSARGDEVFVRVHLEAHAALPLELPARMAEPKHAAEGIWQRAVFTDLGDTLTEGLERFVFRMHRRELADGKASQRSD